MGLRGFRFISAAAVLVVLSSAVPTQAVAAGGTTTVTCGQLITKSIRLANDLHNCPNHGLEVGAGRITINLNGHTLGGTRAGARHGIDNTSTGASAIAHPAVTIKNGTVTNFEVGIVLGPGADRNQIQDILVTESLAGIWLFGVNRVRVSDNAATDNDIGIWLQNATTSRIERNTVLHGIRGIQLTGASAGNVLRTNHLIDNLEGVFVFDTVTATLIDDNDAKGNSDDGIRVDSADAATVISNNRAANNFDFGILAATGVTDGGGNRASGNGTDCSTNISCTPLP